jgi:hypothetical protein
MGTPDWQICKPDPVLPKEAAIIYLGLPSPAGSIDLPSDSDGPSSLPRGFHLRRLSAAGNPWAGIVGIRGLSTPGVYLAAPVTRNTGGLLHHHFTLTAACAVAVYFLLHLPSPAKAGAYPLGSEMPCAVRTFLSGTTVVP